jgi:hypothetical protein
MKIEKIGIVMFYALCPKHYFFVINKNGKLVCNEAFKGIPGYARNKPSEEELEKNTRCRRYARRSTKSLSCKWSESPPTRMINDTMCQILTRRCRGGIIESSKLLTLVLNKCYFLVFDSSSSNFLMVSYISSNTCFQVFLRVL